MVLSIADLAWVQQRIARASATGMDSETDRARRAEYLGTWVGLGVTTTIAIPLVRLLLLLWGVSALAAARGHSVLDVSKPVPQTAAAYGGCAPIMALFMTYYFLVVAALMLAVVAAFLSLGIVFAARTCCPARRSRPPVPDPERVALTKPEASTTAGPDSDSGGSSLITRGGDTVDKMA